MEKARGDILDADVHCIVNPVNCKGIMGAGLAKSIAERYPGVLPSYQKFCREGLLTPGKIQIVRIERATGKQSKDGDLFVMNLPTKDDWRNPSRLDWIEAALEKVPDALAQRGIRSIAFPRLGAGLGGLDWNDVRPLIERAASRMPDVRTIVYEEGPDRTTALGSPEVESTDIAPVGAVLAYSSTKPFPKGALYIGRNKRLWAMSGRTGEPEYGNPFVIGRDGDRQEVIDKFDAWFEKKLQNPAFRSKFIADAAGADLVCHCAPQACHGHVMARRHRELLAERTTALGRSLAPNALAPKEAAPPITAFKNENSFLSNMHPARVVWGDALTPAREWPNVEVPYVLAKTVDPASREAGIRIVEQNLDKGAEAVGKILKVWGKKIPLRKDWESMKVSLMQDLVQDKFSRNPALAAKLQETRGRELREGNYWGDTFWGVCLKEIPSKGIKEGEGRNELGRILMRVRDGIDPIARSTDVAGAEHTNEPEPEKPVGKSSNDKTYAGIGSRETPGPVCELMKDIAEALARKGWVLRSGRAIGADIAFEEGATRVPESKMQIFLPWADFRPVDKNRKPIPLGFTLRETPYTKASPVATAVSSRFHPQWNTMKDSFRKLHARNAHQVLGPDLDDKTDVVVCWTRDGAIAGGTGQALRMAQHYGIPVVNLGLPRFRNASVDDIVAAVEKALEAEPESDRLEAAKMRSGASVDRQTRGKGAKSTKSFNADRVDYVDGSLFDF